MSVEVGEGWINVHFRNNINLSLMESKETMMEAGKARISSEVLY